MNYTTKLNEKKTNEILNLLKNFRTCWNDKDLTKFGAFFTNDAEYTDVTGQSAYGIAAIIEQHKYPFNTVNKHAIFTIDKLTIRSLSDNLSIISGLWTTTGSLTIDGNSLPDRKGVIHFITEYKDNNLLLKLVYNSDLENVFFRKERELK